MKSIMKLRLLPLALVAAMSVTGCARQISPDVVSGPGVGSVAQTYPGVIESSRVVTVQEADRLQGNTTGMLLGGLIGGAGTRAIVGGDDYDDALMTGAGAIAGAGLGALAEQRLARQQALEYVVRTDTGQRYTIVQGPPRLSVGQRVFIQMPSRGRATIVPAGY